jgi:hypothetical protein
MKPKDSLSHAQQATNEKWNLWKNIAFVTVFRL